ncbi:caspase family protein [Streptomyces rochei]|uniref:vWA-MoxR associated conflict system protein n=1 Tax=Streptomyces rochei TaxID=1928 RepID=UPI0033E32A07
MAESLHAALLDRRVGGCAHAPHGIDSFLTGASVTQEQIEKAVRTAAERAGRAEAVLVLAFVGHGTTLGGAPRLFLMASDSRTDTRTTVVNVSDLLAQALDTQGIQGVIAVVDTCHAGGATPDIAALDAGVRKGATRLSLLMSVGVEEDAYGLAFTRGLVRVLRDGVSGAGEYLSAEDVRQAVNAMANTGARVVVADGNPFGAHPWIARNAQYALRGRALLGPVGRQDLTWALEPLGMDVPPASCAAGLERLRRNLDALVNDGAYSIADMTCAVRVTEGLLDALRTTELLLAWPGAPLTSDRIRRAAAAVGGATCPAGVGGGELVRDCVEFLRLRAPRALGSSTAPLARLVAALAVEDGLGPDAPQLSAWAGETGAVLELNDAFAALAERIAEDRLRLVVSLHAAVADEWPETLMAWLLDQGEHVAHEEFPCSPTQSGVEQQLKTVLRWATRRAKQAGSKLKRVEIAASAPLLVRWRPEETDLGLRLGVMHDVVLRWSDRLSPPAHLYWINDYARERLAAIAADNGSGAPLDWLGKQETRQPEELARRLQNGFYERALALSHRPHRLDELLERLLAYTPIVLWPEGEGELPDAARDSVERYWHRLPGEFSAAYRHTWRQGAQARDTAEDWADLARLRSAWLDTEWLDFCDWFETRWTDGDDTQ